MKTLVKFGLALLLSIGVSNTCLAVFIDDLSAGGLDGTDVGIVDDALMKAFLMPGPLTVVTMPDASAATEAAWADMVLSMFGIDTTGLGQVSTISAPSVYTTNVAGVFASDITTTPSGIADYFVVNNGTQWAIFANNFSRDWAVFDVAHVLPDTLDIADLNVSHITLYSNPAAPINEPSVMALIGLGLLGIGFAGRKLGKR